MAKRLNYQIGFTADTSQLQASVNKALESLQKLGETPRLISNLQQASTAALDLAQNLRSAMNQNTGQLDLLTFNNNLKKSGQSLEDYGRQLRQLGPAGQEAFLQVAQAITQAELPLRRSNKLLSELWITMKNTMRWQLTSSVLHGFVGQLETAYGYAKDLNRSLTEIRIVSEQSAEDMARFAKEANNAAKALSTTTTDYTDASLIYYQQGLTDEEVQARTETTIKLANVAGITAETASDQLTAVWNNFYDGSKSLEYYADVMVKLGATTASSSEEISQGMQKFAAVADTVGLSYEYAASALATVTATTRESASIVGTAFRTLFSRIQGLNLGETLDDGTDLNKYSNALKTVGVDIFDTNNKLKDMDVILDELGSKWKNLGKDQQIALAETVAGVRQYTQLIALMDNWDFFQENLATSYGASGSLESQADVYAESWEAARDRVKASAEDIYDSLINPDFYIGVDNVVSPILDRTADLVDVMGGMQGVLAALALLMNKVYGDKIAQSIRDMATNIGFANGQERERVRILQSRAAELIKILEFEKSDNEISNLRVTSTQQYIELTSQLNSYMDQLSPRQKEILKDDLQHIQNLKQQIDTFAQLNVASTEAADTYKNKVLDSIVITDDWRDRVRQVNTSLREFNTGRASKNQLQLKLDASQPQKAIQSIISELESLSKKQVGIRALQAEFNQLGASGQGISKELFEAAQQFGFLGEKANISSKATMAFFDSIGKGQGAVRVLQEQSIELQNALTALGADSTAVTRFIANLNEIATSSVGAEEATTRFKAAIDQLNANIEAGKYKTQDWAETLVSAGTSLSQLSMGINAIKSIGNLWDESLSGTERFSQAIMALSMLVYSGSAIWKQYNAVVEQGGVIAAFAGIKNTYLAATEVAVGAGAKGAAVAVAGLGAVLNTVLGPIMLVLSVVSLLVTAIMTVANGISQANEEAIKKSKEQHEATQEEINANYDLIDSYNELFNTYQETGEDKDDLANKALEVAEALGLEGAAVANLTGDYSNLNEQISKARAELNAQQLQDNINSKDLYGDSFVDAMRKGSGHKNLFGDYSVNLGGYLSDTSAQSSTLKNSDFYRQYGLPNGSTFKGDFVFQTDANAENLVELYEAAQNAAEEMRKVQLETGEEANEAYNNLTSWLAKSKDSYEQYAQILSSIESGSFQQAVNTVEQGDINSYNDYLNYYSRLTAEIQKRVDAGEIEADNVEKLTLTYLAGEESLRKYAIQQQLVNDLTDKFGVDISKVSGVNEALDRLSEENLQVAISLVPRVSNAEEFQTEFERILLESIGTAAQDSMNLMAELVQELNENTHISEDNYKTIQSDTNFIDQIKAEFGDFDNFLKLTEQQQIEYIRDYYTAVQAFATENLDEQKENAQAEYNITLSKYAALRQLQEQEVNGESDALTRMAELRADYIKASTSGSQEEVDAILEKWNSLQEEIGNATGINIRFDIDDNLESIDGLANQLDELSERIEEITSQQIKIAIDWSDFDDIKGQFDSLSDFASIMQDASKKIGDSYQYPIDEIRDWMDVYPELFAKAQVNTNGLISLTQEEVNAFIQGKKDETNANADSKIEQWELQKKDLEVTRDALIAEQTAFQVSEQGKIDLAELSTEQQAKLIQQLTQYQIDRGIDEATAHKNVLESMGLNEEEYSKIVAEVSETNAKNTIDSTAEGAEKGSQILSNFSLSWKNLAFNVGEVAKKIAAALQGEEYEASYKDVFSFNKTTSGYSAASVDADFKAHEADPDVLIEEFKADKLKQLELDLSAIDNAISNIDAKILAAKNLQNAPASEGSKGPSSSKKGSNNDGKIYDEEDKKTLEDIEDRYHEINREIEDQNSLLEDIGDNIDRTYGKDRLSAYEKELNSLTKQQQNYNDKLQEAQNYLSADKNNLLALFGNEIGFKENGEILDYNSMLQKTVDAYNNNFLADYNAFLVEYSALTKTEQEARESEYNSWQTQKQVAEALYNQRLDALKQYEDTLDVVQEINDSLEETARNIADNKLNQIEHRLEVVVTIKDMEDTVRNLTKEIAESFGDMLTHGVESTNLSWEQAQEDMKMLAEYQQTYNEYQNELANATDATDIDRIISNLQDLQGQAVSTAEALLSWIESLETLLPDAIDDASKRFSLFTDQLQHNTSILDTIKELYALQGVTYKTQRGFNELQKISEEKMQAQIAQAQLQKVWYENAGAALAQAEAALEGVSETDAAYDTLKNNRDALLAEYNEAQKAMLEASKSAMETAQEMYLQSIEKAAYDFGQAVSGGIGLDLLQDKYDHYIETEERYLDKVNEAYQVSSWYNKLQVDIDKTTNSSYKKRLKDLQEEIDIRREGNTLSEYDLNILEAKYKVLQAQMALEDAQNNKSQLRLVRDQQGNWNYQYTADQSAIADAQQDLIDAENEWYNTAKQQVKDVTGEIISTWAECQNKIKEIYSDMSLTDEERANKAEEIYQYYTDKIKFLEEEKQNSIEDMTEAGNKSLIDNAILTGDTISDLTGLTSEEIQKIVEESGTSIKDLLFADNETIKNIVGSNTELIDLFDNKFGEDLGNMTNNAVDFETIFKQVCDNMQDKFNEYGDTIDSIASDTGTSLDDLREQIEDVQTSTDECKDAGLDAAYAMWDQLDAIQDLSESYADLADSVYEYIRALRDLAAQTSSTVAGSSGHGGSSGVKYDKNTDYSGAIEYGLANGLFDYGDSTYKSLIAQREEKIKQEGLSKEYYGVNGSAADEKFSGIKEGDALTGWAAGQYGSEEEWRKKMEALGVPGFATGGYTGDFADAKLAFLHKKELVLNANDTSNILSAVSAVRALGPEVFSQIEKAIDGGALAGIALMAERLGMAASANVQRDSVDQTVRFEHIEFPNVTSSDEIQDAFASLINDAAQWAQRRKD